MIRLGGMKKGNVRGCGNGIVLLEFMFLNDEM